MNVVDRFRMRVGWDVAGGQREEGDEYPVQQDGVEIEKADAAAQEYQASEVAEGDFSQEYVRADKCQNQGNAEEREKYQNLYGLDFAHGDGSIKWLGRSGWSNFTQKIGKYSICWVEVEAFRHPFRFAMIGGVIQQRQQV